MHQLDFFFQKKQIFLMALPTSICMRENNHTKYLVPIFIVQLMRPEIVIY